MPPLIRNFSLPLCVFVTGEVKPTPEKTGEFSKIGIKFVEDTASPSISKVLSMIVMPFAQESLGNVFANSRITSILGIYFPLIALTLLTTSSNTTMRSCSFSTITTSFFIDLTCNVGDDDVCSEAYPGCDNGCLLKCENNIRVIDTPCSRGCGSRTSCSEV